jgi:putative SOS response-associated peptidase YedK
MGYNDTYSIRPPEEIADELATDETAYGPMERWRARAPAIGWLGAVTHSHRNDSVTVSTPEQVERGNLPLFAGIFPDYMAPIVRSGADRDRKLILARWGMPGPPQFGGQPVTNIRNLSSPHWRRWLGQANRCIVPATSFCEYADAKPRKTPKWFALSADRPLFAFAGLWTPWRGIRGPKSAPIDGEHELFGFLTTEANAVVAPIHPKAMPVILTTPEEIDLWLTADASNALELQRPLPDDALMIVASGEREDRAPEAA